MTYEEYLDSVAPYEAAYEEEEAISCFRDFLDFIGAKETRYSEWSYATQCHGLAAQLEADTGCGVIPNEPFAVDTAKTSNYVSLSMDLDSAFNSHVEKLAHIYRKMEYLFEAHSVFTRNDYEGYWACDGYQNTFDAIESAAYAALDEYVAAFDEALDHVCSTAEAYLRDVYEYWYSEEAFDAFAADHCE